METYTQLITTRQSTRQSSISIQPLHDISSNQIDTKDALSCLITPTIQNIKIPKLNSYRINSGYISNIHYSGDFNQSCKYNCGALFYKHETHRQICCFGGKVILPKANKLPTYICNLLTGKDNEFRNNIRAYNSALAFTSIGYNEDIRLNNNNSFNPSFRIHGQLYHRIGPLFPNENEIPKFAQMYIYDTEHEINNRTKYFKDLNQNILKNLQDTMHEYNPFISKFKQFALDSENIMDYKIIVKAQSNKDRRNFNIPESSEIAAILPNN